MLSARDVIETAMKQSAIDSHYTSGESQVSGYFDKNRRFLY